ncbi:membrane-bound PQQ-dependent dehydrogenase, glucose/quinate/shikimate family [Novosphingobium colocasiae]|uniref:membrane-bound PQQ-dependent dehydrogenase, glucose/quinate/shikimate family n=1 Tax=Novosphingobium colocasiae TaxID=1256513 RepID=UPI0035AEF9B4
MTDNPRALAADRVWGRIFSLILAICGAALLLGGAQLLLLHGSAYYALSGLALLATAFWLWRGNPKSIWVYLALLTVTWIWALWETGGNGWALVPRTAFLTGLALVFLCPPILRHTGHVGAARSGGRALIGVLALVVVAIAALLIVNPSGPVTGPRDQLARFDGRPTEWQVWGNDAGGGRFAPPAQITPANVGNLAVAWTYETGAAPRPGGAPALAFEVTPLKIGDVLYGCTPHNVLYALDAATGKQIWRHDPQTDDQGLAFANCRGVAYANLAARGMAPAGDPAAACAERIYTGTIDARLLAVDARTGAPCPEFGTNGAVDLRRNIGPHEHSYFYYTSAPTVSGNVIVLGSYGFDGQKLLQPSGVIRAYDLATGRQAWDFDPADPARTAPLGDTEIYQPGTPNSWSISSTDEALGLVYVPLGVATPDYYGGERTPAAEKFSNAIMALDNKTGAVRWMFQTVHHDVWDYDIASQPVLTDFPVGNHTVPALISISKTGDTFVLDRRTGKPIMPVVEKTVPRGDAPGEQRYSRTQPFSPDMPTFAGERLQEKEMWGLTPFDQLWCRVAFKSLRYEGRYTPPSLQGSLQYPGFAGGVNWGGFSIDPVNHLLLVNSNRLPTKARLIDRAEADRRGMKPLGKGVQSSPEAVRAGVPQSGARYAVLNGTLMSPLNVPCLQPPVGELTAVDLVSHKVAWKRPIGGAERMGPMGMASHIPVPFGLPAVGGPMTTAGGLTFIASTPDKRIRAFETRTGKLLWQADIPANGNANPMSYVARDGRQYVIIAAGGSGALATNEKNILVAFALPKT